MSKTKRVCVLLMGLLIAAGTLYVGAPNDIFAASKKDDKNDGAQSVLEEQGLFPSMDREGNITYTKIEEVDIHDELELPEKADKDTMFDLKLIIGDNEPVEIASYDTFQEANAAMTRQSKFRSVGTMAVFTNNQIRAITNGVVNFNTKGNVTTNYTEEGTGKTGYLNGAYGADAAYLGTNSDGTKVKFKMSGVTGWVDKAEVEILDYDSSAVKSVNYYEVYNGYIYHNITTNISVASYPATINVGPMQSYMKNGEYYYSYDGHYFYRTYAQMIADYKAGTYSHAINGNNPYYNYYQFLSFRTKTNFTAAQLNATLATKVGSTSKMWNQGDSFITNQNKYGANAALAFGVAGNESAWGMSQIAQAKNNLFGLKAYDSDPNNASAFISPADCIRQFTQTFVSINYTDPKDVEGLYHGACLGDKSIGFSVKYASAPYWGELNASNAYTIGLKTGVTTDYNKYKIGIKMDNSVVNIRKEPSTSSTILYNTGSLSNYPVVILDTVKSSDNKTWYKIATDAPLSADRTKALQFMPNSGGEYNASVSYAYISADYITVVNDGSSSGGSGGSDSGSGESDTSYKKGDVNNDELISASDYTLVKKYVLGSGTLNASALKAADMNDDGIVTASDYTLIKKHVLGN